MTRQDRQSQTRDARPEGQRVPTSGTRDLAGTDVTGDVQEEMTARNQAGSSRRCRQVMTTDPSCCTPDDTVDKVAQMMKAEDVGSVPVVADRHSRHLMGIITDRDLALAIVAEGRSPGDVRVEEVMTSDPVVCHPEDDVQDALDNMSAHQVRRIPVVDDDGRLVGIIAQADVAVRMDIPGRTASVVEEISQPAP